MLGLHAQFRITTAATVAAVALLVVEVEFTGGGGAAVDEDEDPPPHPARKKKAIAGSVRANRLRRFMRVPYFVYPGFDGNIDLD